MDLIAIKDVGIELPDKKNIDNCIRYNKFYSVSFARNGIITVVKDLKTEDYETLIDYYLLTDKDPIMFCFQGYAENDLGNMPLVISNNHKKFKEKTFETNKPIIAFTDEVLGVKKDDESIEEFISNIEKFDRSNFSEIADLVFGDNLVAIMNPNGIFETYGLELTSTKKWKKSKSGIIYTDEDWNSKTYYGNGGYYNSNSYGGYYDADLYDYEYLDNNAKPYKCDVCNQNVSFVMVKDGKSICSECNNKNHIYGAAL